MIITSKRSDVACFHICPILSIIATGIPALKGWQSFIDINLFFGKMPKFIKDIHGNNLSALANIFSGRKFFNPHFHLIMFNILKKEQSKFIFIQYFLLSTSPHSLLCQPSPLLPLPYPILQ